MQFGPYTIKSFLFGTLRLDGGAMFGPVPKNLWSKRIPADGDNCIPLATRSLLIQSKDRSILVDLGCGDKWDQKRRGIFEINNTPDSALPFRRESITDIILTHLHFDHAGGISHWDSQQPNTAVLSYPQARVFLQKANYENGKSPTSREQASYLPENVLPLAQAQLELVDGESEIIPGIWVHRVDGHTVGLQWVEIRDGAKSILFPADLIPTSHHLPVPFTMGYDVCATTAMQEKERFLEYALSRDAVVVFEHDPIIKAAKLARPPKGHFSVREQLDL